MTTTITQPRDRCHVCQSPATHKVCGQVGIGLRGGPVVVTLCQTHADETFAIMRQASEDLFKLLGVYNATGPVPIGESWNYGAIPYA